MISRTRSRQKNGVRTRVRSGARRSSGKRGEMLALLNRHSSEMLEMVQQLEEARSHISSPHTALGPIFDELAQVVSDHVENLEDWAAILRERPAFGSQRRQLQAN